MHIKTYCYFISLMVIGIKSSISDVNNDVSVLIRANTIFTNAELSFTNKGTDITRWDKDTFALSQLVIEMQTDWTSALSSQVTLFHYPDGNLKTGLTEGFFQYKPLQASTSKWAVRAGLYYPELSAENIDIGWLSKDTFAFSAINSWFAEELRIAGIEVSLSQSGRQVRSPWSWDIRASVYKGNDTLGSLISWRGFAIHDRQTLVNDKVEFAPYPTVTDPNGIWSPDDVPPFKEIDGKTGVYVGAHLTYLRQIDFRYYYYNNKANPNALTPERYYAWHTIFHHLSVHYQINANTHVKVQMLDGSTLMGENVVYTDYQSASVLIAQQLSDGHKLSARIESFDVTENDVLPEDNNHSNGVAATFNYQYDLTSSWILGIEYNWVKNYAYNRPSLDLSPKAVIRQVQLVAQWRY